MITAELHRSSEGAGTESSGRVWLFAGLILSGMILGGIYAEEISPSTAEALNGYLSDFCTVHRNSPVSLDLWRCVILFLGGTCLVFLSGFSSLGVLSIPCLLLISGFLSGYTVCALGICLGRPGVMMAVGILSVRLLFTIPCLLSMSCAAWPLSFGVFRLAFFPAKTSLSVFYHKAYFLLFVFCVTVLFIGICCERFLTPQLYRLLSGV